MAKTLEQKLCNYSFWYNFVRYIFARPVFYFFYRKIDVIGAKDVPGEGAVIFTPNHQNALMDALSILLTKHQQTVFIARADIFRKPAIISILHFLRILPVYRKRDGGNSSDNNQETFDIILKVLQSKQAIGIMPEGTHNKIKRLQMLQKGVFRLAMLAQEKYGNAPMVKIVPVGLEYTSTSKFRSDVMIRYGKAIEVSDFYGLYVENSARAFKQMQDVLIEKMREGMVDIIDEQYYSEIERLRVIYQKRAAQKLGFDLSNAEDRLQSQKRIVAALQEYARTNQEEMSALGLDIRKYIAIIEKRNLRDWVIERQPFSLAGLLAESVFALTGIPFWFLGLLFNYLPYRLSAFASRKVRDPQFITSVQFVAAMVLFPVYYLIMIVLTAIFVPCICGKLIIPLLFIPLGLFAFRYYISMKKLCAKFRLWWNKKRKDHEIIEAIELRKTIFEKMEDIIIAIE